VLCALPGCRFLTPEYYKCRMAGVPWEMPVSAPATNAIETATNAIEVATNSIETATNTVVAATNSIEAATNSAKAATNAVPVLPLCCSDAVARAIRFSEDVIVLRAAVDVARQRVAAAGDWRNPELRLSYGNEDEDATRRRLSYETYGSSASIPEFGSRDVPAGLTALGETVVESEDESRAFRVGLRVFTSNPWEKSARVSGCEAEWELAKAEQGEAEWDLALTVCRRYCEVHYLREDLRLAKLQKGLRHRALDAARSRVKQGVGTVQDVMDASRRYLGVASDWNRADRRLQELLGQLSAMTRLSLKAEDVDTSQVDAEPGSIRVDEFDPEALAEGAAVGRADIAVLVWRSRVADAACRESRAACIPWFNHVQASFASATDKSRSRSASYVSTYRANRLTYDYDFTDDEGNAQEWRIDAALSLPVFYWMNNDQHVRLAERRMALLQEEEARERVRFSIEEALGALGRLAKSAKQYESETEPVIREMEAAIKNHREAPGVLPPEDVARLEEEILDARRAGLESRYDYNMAVISLQEALGRRP